MKGQEQDRDQHTRPNALRDNGSLSRPVDDRPRGLASAGLVSWRHTSTLSLTSRHMACL